jgi:uncharacterized SAM-binding protein YcdF (DUF218 family)
MGSGVAALLTQLVLPLSLSLLLLAGALFALGLGRRRLAAGLVAVSGGGLWLAALPPVAACLAAPLERTHPAARLADIPKADAILLLGGALTPAQPPREFPELSEAADRIVFAARLFHAGKAPLVLVSSGQAPGRNESAPEAAGIAALLELLGVPAGAIVREEQSTNTHENCVRSRPLLEARGARDILLVTSALHMPRALATCRSAGLAVRPAATDHWATDAPLRALDLLPDPQALLLTHLALRERLGFAVYQLRGWIRPATPRPATR